MTKTAVPITQASVISAVAWTIAQLAAFLPNVAKYQQELISIGSTVVVLVFMVVNLGHHYVTAKHGKADTLRTQIRNAGLEPEA